MLQSERRKDTKMTIPILSMIHGIEDILLCQTSDSLRWDHDNLYARTDPMSESIRHIQEKVMESIAHHFLLS